jgi:hypothetical protein
MSQYHKKHTKFCDVAFGDHYDSPVNGTIYKKTLEAAKAANGKRPVWIALNAYKEKNFFPTSQQARNTIYQAFTAGATGIGWYCISYADGHIGIWEVKDDKTGAPIGQELWDGIAAFNEKELPIVYPRYQDKKGQAFNREVALDKGYIYDSWVDENGDMYLVVMNTAAANKTVDVTIPLKSDNGKVSIGGYTATVINGSNSGPITGNGSLKLTLEAGNQTILFKITPNSKVDFSPLG